LNFCGIVFYGNFQKKQKSPFLAFVSTLSDLVFAFSRLLESSETASFQKKLDWVVFGGKIWWSKCVG